MTASLSEILREETLRKAKCSDRVSRCRPLVLSLWAQINTSLQDGWSLRSVWKALKDTGKYPSSYESFRANVRALQGTGGKVESPIPSGQKAVTPEKKPETGQKKRSSGSMR
uniref:TraK family protein n=1 Tax=Bilophila wadsworthia TaxID=35833 RepID=UPI0024321A12